MTYFLFDGALVAGESVELTGDEARHVLGSRRIRKGEALALQGADGRRFRVVLEESRGRGLLLRVGAALPIPDMPDFRLILLQAAVKPKALEWIIQKATELGVVELRFFPSEHGALPIRDLESEKARSRWKRIAWEACKQCDRQFPPGIRVERSFADALETASGDPAAPAAETRWVLDPGADQAPGERMAAATEKESGAGRLLVGPEGGFTREEIAAAHRAGYRSIRLGAHLLRADTAAIAACALMIFRS